MRVFYSSLAIIFKHINLTSALLFSLLEKEILFKLLGLEEKTAMIFKTKGCCLVLYKIHVKTNNDFQTDSVINKLTTSC